MGIWQRITSKVKQWLGGGSSKKSTPPRARRSVSRGSNQSTGGYYSRGSRSRSYDYEEERKKKQKEKTAKAFKATKSETKDITETFKKPSTNGLKGEALGKKMANDYKSEYEKSKNGGKTIVERKQEIDANREKAQKKLDDLKAKRGGKLEKKVIKNARGDDVHVYSHKGSRGRALVGGTGASDMEYRMEIMPKSQSFARGAESGLTLGLSELEAKRLAKLNKDSAKAEKTYQANKSVGAERAGELAGSLVTFGGTEGATRVLGEKAVGKLAPKAAEKLAGKKIIQKTAQRSVEKAVKKGIAKGSGEELIKQVGRDKAKQVVNAIGSDVAQNLTTGAIYDINKASAEHKVGSKDWWKELGTSAALNVGITGAVGGASAVKSSKGLVKDSMETLAKKSNLTKFARENSAGRALKRNAPRIGESIEERIARIDAERLGKNAEKSASQNAAKEQVFGRANQAEDALDRAAVLGDAYGDIGRGVLPKNEVNPRDLPSRALPVRNIKNADRTESASDVLARLVDNANNRAESGSKSRLESLIRVSDKTDARIQEINKELDGVSDAISSARKTDPKREEELIKQFDELMAERNALEYGEVTRETPKVEVDEKARETAAKNKSEKSSGNEQLSIADEVKNSEQMSLEEEVAKEAKVAGNEQEPLAGKVKESEDNPASNVTKKKPPKGKSAKQATEENASNGFEPKMRDRYKHLNEGLKKATDGKVGVRKGVVLAAERASDEEKKRIIKQSGAEVNQAIKDAAENAIRGGDFTYKVFTQGQRDELFFESYNKVKNAESPSQIVEELEDKMLKILRESEANPWASTEQITLSDLSDMLAVEQVYKENGIKFPAEYEEILTRLINLQGTQHGQGQRGRYLLLKEHSPLFRRTTLTKDIAKYIDNVFGLDRLDGINRSLDANHGEKNWLDKEIQRIADYDETFKDLPTVEARMSAAREAYKELEKEILRNTKMSVWDALNLWRHTGMLSALATGGRNLLGNSSQFLMRELSDKMTYFTERLFAKMSKDADNFRPTTVLAYKGKDSSKLANQITSGAVGKLTKTDDDYFKKFADEEYARTITDVVNEAVGDMMNIEKYETHAQKGVDYVTKNLGEGFVKGLAWLPRKVTKAVNFMLNEPDSWFVETRFRKGLMRYLEANGITNSATLKGNEKILKDAIAHAKEQALEDTYKKANRITTVLERVRQAGLKHDDNVWRNLIKKGAMITLDAELPYLKVPVNVATNTLKYSPVNIMKSIVDASTAARRGDMKALSAAAEELSKGITGTGLAVLGFLFNCDEQDDEDSNGFIAKAEEALKEYGIKDNSIKIGDHVYDISNIGQGATQLLMGARAAEIVNENGGAPKGFLDNVDMIRECFSAAFDSVANMSVLDNALGIIDAFSNEGDYEKGISERVGDAATNIGFNYVGQFIPQPLRGVARSTTSADLDLGVKKRDATTTEKRLQYNVNNYVSSIPYLNEKVLPHKVDTHGNLMNERKTNRDKLMAVLNNTVNPLKSTKVHIPEVDKVEMSVKDEDGNPFKPNGFDSKRQYMTQVGEGKRKETVELTGKEREQVARAAKHSGYDMADALVRKGMFGDRLGERAQYILANVPEDEEKARELFFSTTEWKNADNETKQKYLEAMYGEGNNGMSNRGVSRTRKEEAYVGVAGNSEDDFRFQNDIKYQYQDKYDNGNLAELGVSKGQWVDIVESVYDANHKWDEENLKNIDNPNSAKMVKAGILAVEGLTPEQRIAAYELYRGKRTGFGWNDWDGISGGSSYSHYGKGGFGHHRRGGGSKKAPAIKQSAFKAKSSKSAYKDITSSLKTRSSSSSNSTSSVVKIEPPKVKFKKYEV